MSSTLCKLVLFAAAIFVSQPSLARWDVQRLATQKNEIEGTRFLPHLESHLRGFSTLKRVIETRSGDIAVATIANTVTKRTGPDSPAEIVKMAEQIRTILKLPAWTRDDQAGVSRFVTYWPRYDRLLRLAIKSHNGNWLVSYASIHAPFIDGGNEEADLLQRAFFVIEMGGGKKKGKLTAANTVLENLYQQMFPRADAQTGLSPADIQSLIGRIREIQVPNLLENIRVPRNVTDNVRRVTDNLGINSANELRGAIDGLGASGERIGENVSGAIRQAGGDVRAAGADVRNGADTISKTFSAKNAAILTATAVVTAVGTNAILEGGAWAIRELWYAARGELKPEDRALLDARATKAFDDFADAGSQLDKLEKEVKTYGLALTQAVNDGVAKKSGLQLATWTEAEAIYMEGEVAELTDRLKKSTNEKERMECAVAIAQKNQIIREKRSILPIVADGQGKDQVCRKLEALFDNWKNAEVKLQQAKSIVTSEGSTLLSHIRDTARVSLPQQTSTRKLVNRCIDQYDGMISDLGAIRQNMNCDTEGFRPDYLACQKNLREVELLKKEKKISCDEEVATAKATVSPQAVNALVSGMKDQIGTLKKYLAAVAKADCSPGQKASPCDGNMGELAALQTRYEGYVANAKQHCAGMVVVQTERPSDEVSPAQFTEVTGRKADSSSLIKETFNKAMNWISSFFS